MSQPVGPETVEWRDGVVGHDLDAFPGIESIEHGGAPVRAYADRAPSVAAMFDAAVERAPDREAVVFPERDHRQTYADLATRVDRVATGLAASGIERGDVVSVVLSNRLAFVETFLACARLGAICAPVNTRVSARELGYLLDETDPACVVTEASFLDLVAETAFEPPRLFVAGDADSGRPFAALRAADPDPPAVDHDEDDPVCVLYTSGTTGHPKGCEIESFQLTNAAVNYEVTFGTTDGVRSLCTVPLFHGAGLVSNAIHTLGLAGTLVVVDEFTPDGFLSTIESEAVEWVLGVPTNYVLAMERADPGAYDLGSWEIGAYGGAPMPSETIARLRAAFPGVDLCDAYGTTETVAGLATFCPDQYTDDRAETIGIPSPVVQLAVVDGDGDPLGPDDVGELLVRGPIVVDRYLDRPEATAESFASGPTPGLWYHTGDLASIDADGFVSLKGRDRDKLVRGGENIFALDVEEVLVAHDGVLEASVTGFPDAVLGERVLAAVVPKPGHQLTEDDLLAHCRDQLADYKVPEIVRILSELPKNPGGKVLKSELLPEPLEHGIGTGPD
ncbi:MAG: class I adenylate-forming enzyme family protein [Haloarculaceae archaeon]